MRIAITGGTGFVGRHLARRLVADGHEQVIVARGRDTRDAAVRDLEGGHFLVADTGDVASLTAAFAGCVGVAHLAGINREVGRQTYARVHVEGTAHVIEACRRAGVSRVALLSFLAARPACGSPYHESKWAAEELIRSSGLDYTVVKAGMIYGSGDHMLDHLSHALYTFPIFPLVGTDRPVQPVAVDDVVDILVAALIDARLPRATIAVVGPETMPFAEVVRRVGDVTGRRRPTVHLPVAVHRALAALFEVTMTVPLVARAQVQILSEGTAPGPLAGSPPPDLAPRRRLTPELIRAGLPAPARFGLRDLRLPRRGR